MCVIHITGGKLLTSFPRFSLCFSLDLSKFYDLGWPRRARARVAGATGGAGGCFSELAEAHFVMSSIWANFHRSIRPRVDIGWGKFLGSERASVDTIAKMAMKVIT